MPFTERKKSWLIDVNMGYGHQRTAYPLRDLAEEGKIISANDYKKIPKRDKAIWERSRLFYEFISNFKRAPLVGDFFFSAYNNFQKILSFYPKRDLSRPTLSLRNFYSLFKKGWGKDFIDRLKEKPSRPIISTFFIPAFMAEFFDYPGRIFCVVCDADISRSWAPLNPFSTRIRYFAPTERVVERLKLYGVPAKNIFFTGYPLPSENIGSPDLDIIKQDLAERLLILDPEKKYFHRYQALIRRYLGGLPRKPRRSLTIMFAVGGAGAQKEIGEKILKSLQERIRSREVRVILVAGTKNKVKKYFLKEAGRLKLEEFLGQNIEIIFKKKIKDYFRDFNLALRRTDVLWTKPSEISFYSALGIPIIIAPSIGSQEDFNKEWLLKLGSGIEQKNPSYTNQWLFDFLNNGWLAEAAMEGFVEAEKRGVFNIKRIISLGTNL